MSQNKKLSPIARFIGEFHVTKVNNNKHIKKFVFHKDAFEDFTNWAIVNKNIFKRIAELLKDISRTPFEGIGKPEALKHNLKGCWSRRITDEHRLVYQISKEGFIEIISCKGHYSS